MAQLDAMRRYVKSSSGGTSEHTMEQLLHADDQSWAPNTSPTYWKNHDHEEHLHDPPPKKSVLMRVREKARKLRHTLSKKKHSQDENATPAWGVSLEDDDDDDDNAEYYGAPMYESAQAPEEVKETARQHPREEITISDKHILPSMNSSSKEQVGEDKTSKESTESVKENPAHTDTKYTIKTDSKSLTDKPTPSDTVNSELPTTLSGIEKLALSETMNNNNTSESATEKPAPSGTTKPTVQIPESNTDSTVTQDTKQTSKTITESVSERLAPAYAMASGATGMITSKLHDMAVATTAALSPKQSPKEVPRDEISMKKYDKGVSVTEYLKQKLEPGEDEKVLSQVISEAISPKKESPKMEGSTGVVEKVRGAVSSILANEAASKSIPRNSSANNIPISTNAFEEAPRTHLQ